MQGQSGIKSCALDEANGYSVYGGEVRGDSYRELNGAVVAENKSILSEYIACA